MPYLDATQLRARLPMNGEGISDPQVQEAIDAAVEYVSTRTGDEAGDSALARNAAATLAHADLLDIVFPRDATDRDNGSLAMRQNAERALTAYLDARRDTDQDGQPDVPPAYVTALEY